MAYSTDPCRPRICPRVIHGTPLACGTVVLDCLLPLYYTNSVHTQICSADIGATDLVSITRHSNLAQIRNQDAHGIGVQTPSTRELPGPTSTQQRSNHRNSLVKKNLVAPLAQAELEFLSHFFWGRRKAVVRVLLLRLVVLVVVAIQHRQCIRLSDE